MSTGTGTAGHVPVITIDGPVGSGKGTIASRLAGHLGWHFLDSGALYRLVALKALEQGVEGEQQLVAIALALDMGFHFDGGQIRIDLDGREVTNEIRREAVSAMSSRLAVLPAVRAALVERQRAFKTPPGLVADGRDMGTVIFPEADLKIFLTAGVEARAARRYKQLKEKGERVKLSRLFREIEARDTRDSSRAIAPLKPAGDAEIIDSTELNINEVVQKIVKLADKVVVTN